ncbi:hypothetical protein CDAR_38331 [Caerostris darwini]|uniref:Uncharacterized protein n=1 Tax=Caerostris darwini TaxID=1538125 RepID=A0AAV4N3R6_9ARAC|nr:hypothetical protein CDAR_38331 [Caerostris darwini]
MSEIAEISPIKLGWGKKYEITSSKSRDLGEGSFTQNKMGVGAEWRMLPDEMSTTGKRDDHFGKMSKPSSLLSLGARARIINNFYRSFRRDFRRFCFSTCSSWKNVSVICLVFFRSYCKMGDFRNMFCNK